MGADIRVDIDELRKAHEIIIKAVRVFCRECGDRCPRNGFAVNPGFTLIPGGVGSLSTFLCNDCDELLRLRAK